MTIENTGLPSTEGGNSGAGTTSASSFISNNSINKEVNSSDVLEANSKFLNKDESVKSLSEKILQKKLEERGLKLPDAINPYKETPQANNPKAEQPQVEQPKAVPPKPDYVPSKFYNPETGEVDVVALARSYQEAERKLGQKNNPKANKQEAVKPEGVAAGTEEAPQGVDLKLGVTQEEADAVAAGEDFTQFNQIFAEKGDITGEDYDKLITVAESKGIAKEQVDTYIEGVKAQQRVAELEGQLAKIEIVQSIGGEKEFNDLAQWAQKSLSSDELEVYNDALDSGNLKLVKSLLKNFKQRKDVEATKSTKFVTQTSNTSSSVSGFTSREEMSAAISDPRYGRDAQYTNEVRQKVLNKTY